MCETSFDRFIFITTAAANHRDSRVVIVLASELSKSSIESSSAKLSCS